MRTLLFILLIGATTLLSSCTTTPKENYQQAVQSDYSQAYCSFLTLKPADAGDTAMTREMLTTIVYLNLDNVRFYAVEGLTSLTQKERRECSVLAGRVLDYMLLHKEDWDTRRLDVQAGLRGLRYFLTKPEDVQRLNELTNYLATVARKDSENDKVLSERARDRHALVGKPIAIKFTALNGRKVDLLQMRGKVVLVDFWDAFPPCVEKLPRIKAAFEKYHDEGFDVIGITDDTDKVRLKGVLKEYGITWPQYFGGQVYNKFFMEFGINTIPHMFLIGRNGLLRFDNVEARGSRTNFEDKIEHLLAEK